MVVESGDLIQIAEIYRQVTEGISDAITNSIFNLWNPLNEIKNVIETTIKNFARWVWDNLPDWLKNLLYSMYYAWSWIFSALDSIRNVIENSIVNILAGIINNIAYIPQNLWHFLREGFRWIRDSIANSLKTIYDIINWLGQNINNIINQVKNTLITIYNKLYNWLYNIITTLNNIIAALSKTIQTSILNLISKLDRSLKDQFNMVITSIMPMIGFYRWLSNILPPILSEMAKLYTSPIVWLHEKLFRPLFKYSQGYIDEMVPLWNKMLDVWNKWFLPKIKTISDTVTYYAISAIYTFTPHYDIAAWLLGKIRNSIEYEPPYTYEKAWTAAANYLSLVIGMTISNFALTMAERLLEKAGSVGLFLLTSGLGGAAAGGEFSQLFRGLMFGLGLNWLTWIIFGSTFRAVIADPLEEYYRYKYRSKLLTKSEIDEFVSKGFMPIEEAMELYRKMGYKEKYLPYLIRSAYREISLGMLIDMAEYGIISLEDLNQYLVLLRYPPEVFGIVLEYARFRALKDRYSRLQSRLASAYTKGFRNRSEVANMLIALGLRPDYVDWFLMSYDIDLDVEIREDKLRAYDDLFLKGVIDEDDYVRLVSEIIEVPEKLASHLMYLKARKTPKIKVIDLDVLEKRIAKTEYRVKVLKAYREYYVERRREYEEIYNTRIKLLKTKYESRIKSLEEELDRKIEELTKTFEAYRDKTVEEINARIDYWKKKYELASPEEKIIIQAKIELLVSLAATRVRYRERVFRARIEELKKKYMEKINSLRAELETKIELIEKEMDKTLTYFDARINKIDIELEYQYSELEAMKALKARRA